MSLLHFESMTISSRWAYTFRSLTLISFLMKFFSVLCFALDLICKSGKKIVKVNLIKRREFIKAPLSKVTLYVSVLSNFIQSNRFKNDLMLDDGKRWSIFTTYLVLSHYLTKCWMETVNERVKVTHRKMTKTEKHTIDENELEQMRKPRKWSPWSFR